MKYEKRMESPIGPLTLASDGERVTALQFGDFVRQGSSCPVLEQAAEELCEYFSGTRRAFTVPFGAAGTPFQQKVWSALTEIPYGATATYADIAARIGKPKACRAVGGANHNNPLPILVPCHRVIGRDGSLTGYAGGLAIKTALLELERRYR